MISAELLRPLIDLALQEDIGSGDITTELLIPKGTHARMQLNAREPLIAAGLEVAGLVFQTLDFSIDVFIPVTDGSKVLPWQTLLQAEGDAQALLTAERTALNIIQRLCGIATLTHQYVDACWGTNAKILDTRKTMPGMRLLDKYAVTCGGGVNHRFGLYDMVLIKDNHIALAGSVEKAIALARQGCNLPVIVECDTLMQVEEALAAEPDRILLDNMPPELMVEAVRMADGRVLLEASGGVTLQTVRTIAQTGVDFISVGAITHSVPAADIGADIVFV